MGTMYIPDGIYHLRNIADCQTESSIFSPSTQYSARYGQGCHVMAAVNPGNGVWLIFSCSILSNFLVILKCFR